MVPNRRPHQPGDAAPFPAGPEVENQADQPDGGRRHRRELDPGRRVQHPGGTPKRRRSSSHRDCPITMSGLDVTHKALVTLEDIEAIRDIGKRTAVMVAELLDFFKKFHEDYFAGFGGSPLHDPCTIASLVAPDIFTSKKCRVDVECSGALTTGATVVSFARGEKSGSAEGRVSPADANVDVLFDVDREAFVGLLTEALRSLD